MADWLLALAGGVGGSVATVAGQWLKSLGDRHKVDRTVGAKLEEHRDGFILALLAEARKEVGEAKAEAAELRPMVAHLAHFEEALDHIHALLSSETPEERRASERRAAAFLKRMRGSQARGELRQEVQTRVSAERLKRDAAAGHEPDRPSRD